MKARDITIGLKISKDGFVGIVTSIIRSDDIMVRVKLAVSSDWVASVSFNPDEVLILA